MLHAQCTINPNRGKLRQGDVLLLALPDRPWGRLDRKMLLVVEWEDAVMEQRLMDMRRAGNQHPILVAPYAVRDANGRVARFSSKTLDCAALAPALLDPRKQEDAPVLKPAEYAVRVDVESDTPVEEPKGIIAVVVDAVASAWNWLVG